MLSNFSNVFFQNGDTLQHLNPEIKKIEMRRNTYGSC